jgi:hypothetical protein
VNDEERPDPYAHGISEADASTLRRLFLDRPRAERQRVLDYNNASDPHLQREQA